MAEPTPDVNLLQWALNAVSAGAIAAAAWLWNRVAAMELRTSTDMRDVWIAIHEDRRIAAAGRERLLERLGEMPTKADLRELRQDIQKILEARH